MRQIDFMDLMKAYGVWRGLTRSPANKNFTREFCKFLGGEDEEFLNSALNKGEIPDEAFDKVRWLNGPDAKLMYKIWKQRCK